ncbi:MAG: hypothetical protein ACTSQJ_15935 [Promethearchaeota archaeon]
MGLTITEKILIAHCNNKKASAGDFILAKVDKCLANGINYNGKDFNSSL